MRVGTPVRAMGEFVLYASLGYIAGTVTLIWLEVRNRRD